MASAGSAVSRALAYFNEMAAARGAETTPSGWVPPDGMVYYSPLTLPDPNNPSAPAPANGAAPRPEAPTPGNIGVKPETGWEGQAGVRPTSGNAAADQKYASLGYNIDYMLSPTPETWYQGVRYVNDVNQAGPRSQPYSVPNPRAWPTTIPSEFVPEDVRAREATRAAAAAAPYTGALDEDYYSALWADAQGSSLDWVRNEFARLLGKYQPGQVWTPEDQQAILDLARRWNNPGVLANLQSQFAAERYRDARSTSRPGPDEPRERARTENGVIQRPNPPHNAPGTPGTTSPGAGLTADQLERLIAEGLSGILGLVASSRNPLPSTSDESMLAAILGAMMNRREPEDRSAYWRRESSPAMTVSPAI